MNEQHPDSGTGSGKGESGASTPDEQTSLSESVQYSPSGRRITRKLGRPAVGKPEQVRLSESERAIALELGKGILAKGVRVALTRVQAQDVQEGLDPDLGPQLMDILRSTWSAENPDALQPPTTEQLTELLASLRKIKPRAWTPGSKLSAEASATADELGSGDVDEGIRIALAAAQFLGIETARKMAPNGTGTARKRR